MSFVATQARPTVLFKLCVQISTFGRAVLELFPTTTFIFLIPAEHWVDSFISRPFSSAWSCCNRLPWIFVLFASELFWLPAEQPVWDLLSGRLGFSRPRGHWFISPPITSHFSVFDWPALPRRTEKERGIMRWYVTHAGDKLSLSVAASQLMENPAEFSKKK